jgi:A/G-specific adenine glycosylase
MAVLRASPVPVPRSALEEAVADGLQRERCLDSLVADGLVEPLARGHYRLPVHRDGSTPDPVESGRDAG